ncbi:MAG: PTS mannose transporter subunit IIAB [Enterobacteriaceae bacterium PSpicST2]|nr:MAG: PTS mannose transporter subunit IIAB [Enterobacteriaceae bacterium PSpicST2]WMC19055.1 MAG: PTS mannose transporter subunit IIAB [Enterobacteriaceae bacterium PSpicST1]
MTVAIIITAHGSISKQLLITTEMLIGKQKNVACVDFLTGDNTDNLYLKYKKIINSLNIKKGIIFLVDIWGGSPFNVSSRIVIKKNNAEIISGVNIPMLIELFMIRNDNVTFNKLISVAFNYGQRGIKLFKNKNIKENKQNNLNKIKNNNNKNNNTHMKIILARIDDRLIHGQIVTRWVKEININRIIVISDEVNNDNIRKTLLTQISPPGITSHVVGIDKAVRVWNNPKYSNDNVMLLFTNPIDVLKVIKMGVIIKSINIGGMSYKKGKIQINNIISVDKEDIKAFKKLNSLGIELEVRKISNDNKINIMDLINTIKYKI